MQCCKENVVKLTASQLRKVIKEEIETLLEAPRAKGMKGGLPSVGSSWEMMVGKRTPATYNVVHVDPRDKTIYCELLKSGKSSEVDLTLDQWNDLVGQGLTFSHQEEW
jgi:hypothetical protein